MICLWRREKEKPSMVREEEEFNEEWWKVFKTLRGHLDDVYDLSWSRNGQHIVSGISDSHSFRYCLLSLFPHVSWMGQGKIIKSRSFKFHRVREMFCFLCENEQFCIVFHVHYLRFCHSIRNVYPLENIK